MDFIFLFRIGSSEKLLRSLIIDVNVWHNWYLLVQGLHRLHPVVAHVSDPCHPHLQDQRVALADMVIVLLG